MIYEGETKCLKGFGWKNLTEGEHLEKLDVNVVIL